MPNQPSISMHVDGQPEARLHLGDTIGYGEDVVLRLLGGSSHDARASVTLSPQGELAVEAPDPIIEANDAWCCSTVLREGTSLRLGRVGPRMTVTRVHHPQELHVLDMRSRTPSQEGSAAWTRMGVLGGHATSSLTLEPTPRVHPLGVEGAALRFRWSAAGVLVRRDGEERPLVPGESWLFECWEVRSRLLLATELGTLLTTPVPSPTRVEGPAWRVSLGADRTLTLLGGSEGVSFSVSASRLLLRLASGERVPVEELLDPRIIGKTGTHRDGVPDQALRLRQIRSEVGRKLSKVDLGPWLQGCRVDGRAVLRRPDCYALTEEALALLSSLLS